MTSINSGFERRRKMRKLMLYGWLVAMMALSPAITQAVDNWDGDWAYLATDEADAKNTISPTGSNKLGAVCSYGVNHYGSPCDCANSKMVAPALPGELIVCENLFGSDEDFLNDFHGVFERILDFSFEVPVLRVQNTCLCPDECGGSFHCGGCGAHEEEHGECGECGEYNCTEGGHCEGCAACGGPCDSIFHEPPIIIASIPPGVIANSAFPPGATYHLACQSDTCETCASQFVDSVSSNYAATLAAAIKAYCTGNWQRAREHIDWIRTLFNNAAQADRLQAGMNRARAAYDAVTTAATGGNQAAITNAWNNAKNICGGAQNAQIWLDQQPAAVQNAVNAIK